MKVTRLDLDGAGSPSALVTRILQIETDLQIPVPIEQLCERFDIVSIEDLVTEGFEAALVTDELKRMGGILIAKGKSRKRRRYSIGHELGHFLIPTHMPPNGVQFLCSAEDLRTRTKLEQDRHARMEAEANQFAAMLLMPPLILRAELRARKFDMTTLLRLEDMFDVSKEAMARACVDNAKAAIAFLIVRHGQIMRMYRREGQFPYIAADRRQHVPLGSAYHDAALASGTMTEMDECELDVWLNERDARRVELLEEQVLFQRDGFALILLRAEMRDDDQDEPQARPRW